MTSLAGRTVKSNLIAWLKDADFAAALAIVGVPLVFIPGSMVLLGQKMFFIRPETAPPVEPSALILWYSIAAFLSMKKTGVDDPEALSQTGAFREAEAGAA